MANTCSSCNNCYTKCACSSNQPRYCGPDLDNIGATSGVQVDVLIQNISEYLDGIDASGSGNTSILTDNGDGTYTHNDGTGTLVTISTRDLIVDWIADHYYLMNEEMTMISPTTGHRTLYRRTNSGTSFSTWDDKEEVFWTPIATLGLGRLFADDTSVAPATAGAPTVAEITAYLATQTITDGLVYYTGTDLSGDPSTYVYWVDLNGAVTLIEEPSSVTNTFADDVTLVADVTQTVTHNLGTTDIIIQYKDPAGDRVFLDEETNYTVNTIDIKASISGTYRVMITAI